jgi:hypothetical protein
VLLKNTTLGLRHGWLWKSAEPPCALLWAPHLWHSSDKTETWPTFGPCQPEDAAGTGVRKEPTSRGILNLTPEDVLAYGSRSFPCESPSEKYPLGPKLALGFFLPGPPKSLLMLTLQTA